MIRILHLTDFHLNKKTLEDWNDYYKETFFSKLEEISKEKTIDLVLFTGDLIDQAGRDFGSPKDGFKIFEKEIINPILDLLEINISQFIICPGNHDIDRSADNEIDEHGMRAYLTSIEKVNEFIKQREVGGGFEKIQRIKDYKEFEFDLYKSSDEPKEHSIFKFSIRLNIEGKSVGVSSINSAWRCFDNDDYGRILIGEKQLNDNYKFIKDCDIKIALLHHQVNWVSHFEKGIIHSHINKNYDIVLSGHVHEGETFSFSSFIGQCFHNISPSGLNNIRTDSRKYSNGFTLIDYNHNVECKYYKYNHDNVEFVLNTDLVPNGTFYLEKPEVGTRSEINISKEAIKNIIEDHSDEMNSHFIKGKEEKSAASVKDSFVFHP